MDQPSLRQKKWEGWAACLSPEQNMIFFGSHRHLYHGFITLNLQYMKSLKNAQRRMIWWMMWWVLEFIVYGKITLSGGWLLNLAPNCLMWREAPVRVTSFMSVSHFAVMCFQMYFLIRLVGSTRTIIIRHKRNYPCYMIMHYVPRTYKSRPKCVNLSKYKLSHQIINEGLPLGATIW